MENISNNIKLVRELSKLSQAKFGELFDASKDKIFNIEAGRGGQDQVTVAKIAEFVDLTVEDLFKRKFKPSDFHTDLIRQRAKEMLAQKAISGKDVFVSHSSTDQSLLTLTESNRSLSESTKILAETNQQLGKDISELVAFILRKFDEVPPSHKQKTSKKLASDAEALQSGIKEGSKMQRAAG